MLDKMRKHSRSFIIYIFFGIIIAVFVINFGPQSQGCTSQTTHAGQIDGTPISINDIGYALGVSGLRRRDISDTGALRAHRSAVIDAYVVRELLANEARKHGLDVAYEELSDTLFKGRFLALGRPQRIGRNENDTFDYDLFSRTIRYTWGISVKKFEEHQDHELLAERMLELLRVSVKVSEEETRNTFTHQSTRAQLQYARFDAADFRRQVEADPKAVDAFLKTEKARIAAYYERNKAAYKDTPATKRNREIAITLWTDDQAMLRAKREASNYLARAEAGEKLSEMFASDPAKATPDEEPKSPPAAAAGTEQPATMDPQVSLKETPPFPRSPDHLIPGIGISEAISRAAFELGEGALAKTPFAVGSAVYLVALKKRTQPDMDEWKRRKDELVDQLHQIRAEEAVREYKRRLCEQAVADHRVVVHPSVLEPQAAVSDKAGPEPAGYVPCQSLQATASFMY